MLYWYKRELMAILKEKDNRPNLKIFNKVISLNLLFSLSFYANFEEGQINWN